MLKDLVRTIEADMFPESNLPQSVTGGPLTNYDEVMVLTKKKILEHGLRGGFNEARVFSPVPEFAGTHPISPNTQHDKKWGIRALMDLNPIAANNFWQTTKTRQGRDFQDLETIPRTSAWHSLLVKAGSFDHPVLRLIPTSVHLSNNQHFRLKRMFKKGQAPKMQETGPSSSKGPAEKRQNTGPSSSALGQAKIASNVSLALGQPVPPAPSMPATELVGEEQVVQTTASPESLATTGTGAVVQTTVPPESLATATAAVPSASGSTSPSIGETDTVATGTTCRLHVIDVHGFKGKS